MAIDYESILPLLLEPDSHPTQVGSSPGGLPFLGLCVHHWLGPLADLTLRDSEVAYETSMNVSLRTLILSLSHS